MKQQELQQWHDYITQLANLRGNAKSMWLKSNFEAVEPTLRFLLDPQVLPAFSKNKLLVPTEVQQDSFKNMGELFEFITNANGRTSHDNDRLRALPYLNDFNGDLVRLFTKKLKVGVQAATFNKVALNLGKEPIQTFDVMLATSIDKIAEKTLSRSLAHGGYVTTKYDGVRTVLIDGVFYSRQGKVINNLVIEHESLSKRCVFDGELVPTESLKEGHVNAEDAFYGFAGMINRKDGQPKEGVTFVIFDMLPKTDFLQGHCDLTYEDRRYYLDNLDTSEGVTVAPVHDIVYSVEEAQQWADKLINQGEEGAMVNIAHLPYEAKRCTGLLKVKQSYTNDGRIVGMVEGENKYEGMLGHIKITYKEQIVNIGSGFSDEERAYFWNNQDSVIGKIGEYKFTTESIDSHGNMNLRFARWIKLREDKDSVNYED